MYVKGMANGPHVCSEECIRLDPDDPEDNTILHDGSPQELGVAYLPHSCGDWIIGGREQVKQLIADLIDILGDMPE